MSENAKPVYGESIIKAALKAWRVSQVIEKAMQDFARSAVRCSDVFERFNKALADLKERDEGRSEVRGE